MIRGKPKIDMKIYTKSNTNSQGEQKFETDILRNTEDGIDIL